VPDIEDTPTEDAGPVTIDLDRLAVACPRLSPAVVRAFAEAAAVCLEHQGHTAPVQLDVSGDVAGTATITWAALSLEQTRSHADVKRATEHGAVAVACALVSLLTRYDVLEQAEQGTGFDYWLKDPAVAFVQGAARLEASGILAGDEAAIRVRVRQKAKQIQRSNTNLPGYVVVVEFGRPCAKTLEIEAR
jgi:hypothetical protein